MSQIRITPQELYDGSTFTLDKARSISEELESLKSRIDSVSANWEGAAQSSFVASFNELYSSFMSKFPEVVQGVAGQMKSAAQTLEEADQKIAQALKG